jgi:hypothetical protein
MAKMTGRSSMMITNIKTSFDLLMDLALTLLVYADFVLKCRQKEKY